MKVTAGPPASAKTQALRAGKNPPIINRIMLPNLISIIRTTLNFL